jgi:imidazolonepropionase-like amidohydrolase
MKRYALVVALIVLAVPVASAQGRRLGVVNVAVVDLSAGTIASDMTLLIDGETIAAVAPTKTASLAQGVEVINGRGLFVIPGLWDMHTHLSYARSNALLTLIANGVTTVRDVGSDLAEIDQWRGRIDAGGLVGPQIIRAGPILNGRESNRYQLAITNAGDAKATVRALQRVGVDLVKVHRQTPREAYFAAIQEAHRLALPLSGHVPLTVTPAEASDAGQATIEHAETLFEGTFSMNLSAADLPAAIRAWRSSAMADALFATFVRNDTTVDPTLSTGAYAVRWLEHRQDPRDQYLATSGKREIEEIYKAMRENSGQALAERKPLVPELSAVVGQMHRAGVRLVTGTDMSFGIVHPGFSMHEELEALVEAGLTPAEALRAATINPAHLFPKTNAGVVGPGKRADLVLLEANPLDDIRNTQRIRSVMVRGRYFDRKALVSLLAESAALARAN